MTRHSRSIAPNDNTNKQQNSTHYHDREKMPFLHVSNLQQNQHVEEKSAQII